MHDKNGSCGHSLDCVYTVEASLVFPVCFLLIAGILCFTFDIYREVESYIETHQPQEIEAVTEFRKIDLLKSVVGLDDGE